MEGRGFRIGGNVLDQVEGHGINWWRGMAMGLEGMHLIKCRGVGTGGI